MSSSTVIDIQKDKILVQSIWDEAYKKWPAEEGATLNDAGDGYLDSFTIDRAIWVNDQLKITQ